MSGIGEYYRAIKTHKVREQLKKEKNCRISWRSTVDFSNCKFEGCNSVGKFTILNHCSFGRASYISENSCLIHTEIGRFCAIGPFVHIVNGSHPTKKIVSIHPAFYSTARQAGFTYVKEEKFAEFKYADYDKKMFVSIGNDVWIGDGASIMEGVHIGDGTIVAAGAIVVKDTEPYSIVGGVPAKIIRYRFSEDDIKFLLKLQWWNKENDWIEEHAQYFNDIKKLRQIVENRVECHK